MTETSAKPVRNGPLALFGELLLAHPGRSALMIGSLFFAALAEGVSFAALLPLLKLAVDPGAPVTGGFEATVVEALAAVGLPFEVGVLILVLVAGILLKAGLVFFAMRNVGYVVAQIATELRLELIRALMEARWSYFKRQPIGTLANAINKEAEHASTIYQEASQIVAYSLQVAVYLTLAVMMSWQFTSLALVAGGLLFFAFRILIRYARQIGKRQARSYDELTRQLADGLHGIKALKAMAAEDRLEPLLAAEAQELNVAKRQHVVVSQLAQLGREPVAAVFMGLALYMTLSFWNIQIEAMLVISLLFYRTLNWLGTLMVFYQSMAANEAFYLSLKGKKLEAVSQREKLTGSPAPLFEQALTVEHVSFAYDDTQVLRDVSMEIPARTLVAVYGASGGGKTTLGDLLLGLVRPSAGDIRVDGVSLGDIELMSWRRQVGYVPQEVVLFHDTIFANITLGDDSYSHDDAQAALIAAEAWDFVRDLPEGLDTLVGEHGARFSGGQRQRLALARALIRRPRLLLLDEPTSALDPVSEEAVCQTLKRLASDTTVLVISHQPALLRVADVVFRAVDGTITRMEPEPFAANLKPIMGSGG